MIVINTFIMLPLAYVSSQLQPHVDTFEFIYDCHANICSSVLYDHRELQRESQRVNTR